MKGKWGFILFIFSLILAIVIYYDSKSTNIIPSYFIIIDGFILLVSIIIIKHTFRKHI